MSYLRVRQFLREESLIYTSEMFYQSTPIKQIFAEWEVKKGPTSELYTIQNLRAILSFSAAIAKKYFTPPLNQY